PDRYTMARRSRRFPAGRPSRYLAETHAGASSAPPPALSQEPRQYRTELTLSPAFRFPSAPLSSVVPTVVPAVHSRAGSLPDPTADPVSLRAQFGATLGRQPGIR